MTKEHGDWREHENVRAHFALLRSRGYAAGEGEAAHLERAFQLDSLERPALRASHPWIDGTGAGEPEEEGGETAEAGDANLEEEVAAEAAEADLESMAAADE